MGQDLYGPFMAPWDHAKLLCTGPVHVKLERTGEERIARTTPPMGLPHLSQTPLCGLGAGVLPAAICSPEEPPPGKSSSGDVLYKLLCFSPLAHQTGCLADTSAVAPEPRSHHYCCEDICKAGENLVSSTSSLRFQFQKPNFSQILLQRINVPGGFQASWLSIESGRTVF